MSWNETPEVSDRQILAALRPLYEPTRERARMAEIVERLRDATDADEIAERDRCGNRMAELDRDICVQSVEALDRIGLWHAAGMIEAALSMPPELLEQYGSPS
ncbi:hypothetical protein ACFVUS_33630 [Nocardia sp. NPDC058058]|uniref:hypothetical protein n=1 Tax=Nocardia sp. NPDC058058 TaxID=3346317 RepID=UPI0036DCEE86